jgi:hypothetical protein
MARVSPIYEAGAKVSEILRRVTAAASVRTFFLASVTTFLLASCGSSSTAQEHHSDAKSSQPTYDAAIGRFYGLVLVRPLDPPEAARIVFDALVRPG